MCVCTALPCQAVEDQAINRVHRLGQTKPVLIKRLVTADTVEQTLLVLQVCWRGVTHPHPHIGTRSFLWRFVCARDCANVKPPLVSFAGTLAAFLRSPGVCCFELVFLFVCGQEKKRSLAASALSTASVPGDANKLKLEDLMLFFR